MSATDFFGNEIKVGQIVAHAWRRGSGLYIDEKIVTKVEGDKVWTKWSPTTHAANIADYEQQEIWRKERYPNGVPYKTFPPVNRSVRMYYNERLIIRPQDAREVVAIG